MKDPVVYAWRVTEGHVFFPFIDDHSISQVFHKAKKKLGIPGHFHDLYKTTATTALDRNIEKRIIQRCWVFYDPGLSGSDGKVTDNHYLKVSVTAPVRKMRGKVF